MWNLPKDRERGGGETQAHRWAPPFYLLYQKVLNGNQKSSFAKQVDPLILTSYGRPLRIHYDGEIHIVPLVNEREDRVDVDLVFGEYLLRVDAGHQDRCIVCFCEMGELRECSQARLEEKETTG